MSEPTGISENNLAKLQALFDGSGVGRILISTYTDDKTEWVVPTLEEILGRAKP